MTKQSPRFLPALVHGLLIEAEINNCPGFSVSVTFPLDDLVIAALA